MYATVSFEVDVFGKFKNSNEVVRWLKSNHNFLTADNGADYPEYSNPKFKVVSEKHNAFRVLVTLNVVEKKTEESILTDVKYFEQHTDEDGNHPVGGELVRLNLLRDTFVLKLKKASKVVEEVPKVVEEVPKVVEEVPKVVEEKLPTPPAPVATPEKKNVKKSSTLKKSSKSDESPQSIEWEEGKRCPNGRTRNKKTGRCTKKTK